MGKRGEGKTDRKPTEKHRSKATDRKKTEHYTEERQKEHRKKTELVKTGDTARSKWMQRIDQGRGLPDPEHTDYKRFLKAWRGWYAIACESLDKDTAARNQYYYDKGKEHLRGLDIQILEIPHTGSVQICTPKKWGEEEDRNEVFSYEVA